MLKYRDASCYSRRAASDLLSWSMGRKPRFGHDFDRVDYQAPSNPAKPKRSASEIAGEVRGRARTRSVNMLRTALLWWLSFDEKGKNQTG